MAEEQNRSLQDKFMLRLPDGMRDRLRDEAAKNNRSMNAEIVARLEASLTDSVVADTNMFRMIEEANELAHKQNRMIEQLLELVEKLTVEKTNAPDRS